MVVIIDYGIGNTGSIIKMSERLGFEAVLSKDPVLIADASHIILPGVGSFDNAILKLHNTGLVPLLTTLATKEDRPFLGICLGMQLLFNGSEEGIESGLGWIDGHVIKFSTEELNNHKIPHMGWNQVLPENNSNLFRGSNKAYRFYFTHSYHATNVAVDHVIGRTPYGNNFISAVQRRNIYGVQFHPEKSHNFGLDLLRNFLII